MYECLELIQVGSNGIISFGTSENSGSNSAFPGSAGKYLIAPYWDDINTGNGGTIAYQTFESGYFLDLVNTYIVKKIPVDFEGTWMLVAHYDHVEPFTGSGEVYYDLIHILKTSFVCSLSSEYISSYFDY